MRLEFSNKKERKNCQGFIRALKEVQRHHPKDSQRPVFLTLTNNDLRLAPSSSDPHLSRVEATCEVVIKNQSFAYQQQNLNQVFRFKSFKLLRAFRKNQNKIVLIGVKIENEGMTVYFQTENKTFICEIKVECSYAGDHWPQSIESTQQSHYQLIPICKVGEAELSTLSFGEGKDNLWVQMAQQGLFFRTVQKGKYRHQSRIKIGQENNFNFANLKAKLKNKVFMNLAGGYILDHLHEIQKKKKIGNIYVKIVWDPYVPNRIRYSYLLCRINTDLGYLIKVVQCEICEEMGEQGQRGIRQEVDERQKEKGKESYLLKKEEGIDEMRRIVINKVTEVDQDKREAHGAFLERRPVNRIEEGEQTVTRRYQSKY